MSIEKLFARWVVTESFLHAHCIGYNYYTFSKSTKKTSEKSQLTCSNVFIADLRHVTWTRLPVGFLIEERKARSRLKSPLKVLDLPIKSQVPII